MERLPNDLEFDLIYIKDKDNDNNLYINYYQAEQLLLCNYKFMVYQKFAITILGF